MIKVFLAIPLNEPVHPKVLDSILNSGSGYVEHAYFESADSKYLDAKRNSCVTKFLEETDCTHLLFWDADTIADSMSLSKLLEADKPVIGAVIYKKGGEFEPCFGYWDEARKAYTTPIPFKYNEILQVDIVGTGFLLIKREVLEKLSYPYFQCSAKGQSGEDVYFSLKCKEAGIPVYVDTGLHLGHIAKDYIVTNETYEMRLYWNTVRDILEQGKGQEFYKVLKEFIKREPTELMEQDDPQRAYKLLKTNLSYRPDDYLRRAYLEYVKEVSSPEWAISWQLAVFLDKLCLETKPKKILNLGSGFSSYVFRRRKAQVICCDADKEWLNKTKQFLEKHNLDTSNLINLEVGVSYPELLQDYDLILLDYKMDERTSLFHFCREKGKILVLDDLHYKEYHDKVKEFFRNDIIFDLREETTDIYGRYSWMVIPRK